MIYQQNVLDEVNQFYFKTEGAYITSDSMYVLYFYTDGTMRVNSMFNSNEGWGEYKIMGENLYYQYFNRKNDEICKRSVFESKGEIVNDTTIIINSNYSYWFDKTYSFGTPREYRFHPTSTKPDSTLAWYKNRKWYIRSLHQSRK